MKFLRQRPFAPLLRITFVRFGLVSLFSEGLYFLLYGLIIAISKSTSLTLAVVGGLCLLINAYIHSRITFRVEFRWKLLLGYLQIQFVGFLVAFVIGLGLEQAKAGKWMIALITYSVWAAISFLLTKHVFRTGKLLAQPSYTTLAKRK